MGRVDSSSRVVCLGVEASSLRCFRACACALQACYLLGKVTSTGVSFGSLGLPTNTDHQSSSRTAFRHAPFKVAQKVPGHTRQTSGDRTDVRMPIFRLHSQDTDDVSITSLLPQATPQPLKQLPTRVTLTVSFLQKVPRQLLEPPQSRFYRLWGNLVLFKFGFTTRRLHTNSTLWGLWGATRTTSSFAEPFNQATLPLTLQQQRSVIKLLSNTEATLLAYSLV